MLWSARRRRGEASGIEAVLDEIPLVPPWTVSEFCTWIEDRYCREVILYPWATEAPQAGEPGSCGVLWVTRNHFVINYDDARSERNQRQQIFHEMGHILCGHQGGAWASQMTGQLVKGLDPGAVERVLYRGIFDTDEERMAELLGTRLAVLSRQQRGDARFDRIASAFFEPVKR